MIAGRLWVVYNPSTTLVLVSVWFSVSIVDVIFEDKEVPAK